MTRADPRNLLHRLMFCRSSAEITGTMKLFTLFLSLFLSVSVVAQDDADSPVVVTPKLFLKHEAEVRMVAQNVVRTAYLVVHGTLDGFDSSAVSLTSADGHGLEMWMSFSHQFGSRLGVLRSMEKAGKVYHLYGGLLKQRAEAARILKNHYNG